MKRWSTLILLVSILAISLLPGRGGGNNPTSPGAPTALTATFSSGNIDLSWTASSSPEITGYNVYRSDDYGYTYDQINAALNPGTTYQDNAPRMECTTSR